MTNTQDVKSTENDIIASLTPLIGEYFCGEITVESNCIIYRTRSGQAFKITVNEV